MAAISTATDPVDLVEKSKAVEEAPQTANWNGREVFLNPDVRDVVICGIVFGILGGGVGAAVCGIVGGEMGGYVALALLCVGVWGAWVVQGRSLVSPTAIDNLKLVFENDLKQTKALFQNQKV